MSSADYPPSDLRGPTQYARFSRRLRGIFIDWTITLVVIFGALIVASSARNDDVSRILGAAVILALVFYEPLLVSRTGGTVGHHLTNLRVVDDDGGNVSFLKAVARFAIKSAIGWYSFVLMALTRRNQTIHDLLTGSTVQIRDAAKARPGQFIIDRVELAHPDMPSPLRRIAVIAAYLLLAAVVALAGEGVIRGAGIISQQVAPPTSVHRASWLPYTPWEAHFWRRVSPVLSWAGEAGFSAHAKPERLACAPDFSYPPSARQCKLRAGCRQSCTSLLSGSRDRTMIIKVRTAKVLGDHRLLLEFSDNMMGERDFSQIAREKAPMLEPLRDVTYFQRVFVEEGVLTWPNGYDWDSVALRDEMKDAGQLRPVGDAAE
jgi:uncharacterized RDD family membrane protein YckC